MALPIASGPKGPPPHQKSNLWEWEWNTHALQQSGEIPEVGHSWLWLVDLLADVCSMSDMFAGGQVLPKEIQQWTRTQTHYKPCTVRGVDWECVKARNMCKAAGTDISPLTSEDAVKRVLDTEESRECVRTQDWVQLEKVSGIRCGIICAMFVRSLCGMCAGIGVRVPPLVVQSWGVSGVYSL